MASTTPFHDYCVGAVFEPAGMRSTRWFLADVNLAQLATPYADKIDLIGMPASCVTRSPETPTGWHALAHYGWPTYPDGMVRTTAEDLGRFAIATLSDVDGGSSPVVILDTEVAQQMLSDQVIPVTEGRWGELSPKGQGFGWRRIHSERRQRVWGHGGRDPGVRTLLLLDLDAGLGVVLMTNSSARLPIDADRIMDAVELVDRPS
jgi:CubicO group peptidase (beta-lactamase class C family)